MQDYRLLACSRITIPDEGVYQHAIEGTTRFLRCRGRFTDGTEFACRGIRSRPGMTLPKSYASGRSDVALEASGRGFQMLAGTDQIICKLFAGLSLANVLPLPYVLCLLWNRISKPDRHSHVHVRHSQSEAMYYARRRPQEVPRSHCQAVSGALAILIVF